MTQADGPAGPAATFPKDMARLLRDILDPPTQPGMHHIRTPPDEYDDGNEVFKPMQPTFTIERCEPERPMWLGGRRPDGGKQT
jgi:hypothetical protein